MGISNGAGGTVPTPAPVAPVVTPPVVSTPTTTTPVATTPTTTTPVATTPTTTASGSAPIAGTASAGTTMSSAASSASIIALFQQVLQMLQVLTGTGIPSNSPLAGGGSNASDIPGLISYIQSLAASAPQIVAAILGVPQASVAATVQQIVAGGAATIQPMINAMMTQATAYAAANPTYAPAGFTPYPTGTPAPASPGLTGSSSPSNPIIPLGGTGTGPGGVSVSNQGGTLIDNNTGLPVGQTSTESTGAIETSVDAWAQSVGLGALAPWINAQIGTYAGEGMDSSDIATTIANTINTAPGFDALMPGYNQRIANGFTNTDANTGAGIAGYLAYRQQIQAMAETAGMVPGTISPQMIGNSWANDVSTTELSERITTEYTDAANALPAVQAELANYGYTAGLTPGQLASMFLNPALTVQQLEQQLNSATAGGEGVLTGFGEIGQSQAYALQAFLSNGGQNNLTTGQAASFFGGPLGSGLNSLSVMAQTGFEGPQLGTAANGPGVVSQAQLLGAGEGNAADILATQRAAQTRAAPSQGGGGLEASQAGVGGVGFGSQ